MEDARLPGSECEAQRELRWWSRAQLDSAAARWAGPWQAWCRDWGLDPGPVTAANACERDATAALVWTPCQADIDSQDRRHATMAWMDKTISQVLFGCAVAMPGSIAQAVAARATRQWAERLGCTGAAASVPPASCWRAWSGALIVECRVAGAEACLLRMLITADMARECVIDEDSAARTPVPPAAAPVPMVEVVKGHVANLNVCLAPSCVDLGSLMGLRVGDILTTGHPLDAPLQVEFAGDADTTALTLCGARLGQRASQRAVALVPVSR